MKIIFFGTAEFAVDSLKLLHRSGHQILAVVTTPDKPAGRGLKPRPSPVKKAALELGLKILQPTNLKDPGFAETLKQLSPELQVVVAFRFLPKQIWEIPPKGTVNLHASYLPNYRGAAPINWVLINGEQYTGVATFFINEKIDTGNIILRKKVEILPEDTAGTLHDRLKVEGAELLVRTVELLEQNKVRPIPQEELIYNPAELKTAPKISKQDCKIDWNRTPTQVYNFIRGLSPYPGAWTNIRDKARGKTFNYVKIHFARPVNQKHELRPGSIISDDKNFMQVAVKDGFVDIREIQMPGKNKLDIKEFIKGYKPSTLEII